MLTIRFFAGAAEAAGQDSCVLDAAGKTVAQVVTELGESNESLMRVLQVSSLLLDGARVQDQNVQLGAAKLLDVLPPFAGG